MAIDGFTCGLGDRLKPRLEGFEGCESSSRSSPFHLLLPVLWVLGARAQNSRLHELEMIAEATWALA